MQTPAISAPQSGRPTAAVVASVPALASLVNLGLAAPAFAAPGAEATPVGPWLFGCVALLLVALLAYLAGARSRAAPSHTTSPLLNPTPQPAQAATPAAADLPGTLETLLQDDPSAVRLLRRAPAGADAGADAGAGEGAGAAVVTSTGTGWELVVAHPPVPAGSPWAGLPAAVCEAAEQLPAGSATQVEHWHLRRAGSGAAERLVLRRADGGQPSAEQQAAFSFTVSHDLRAPLRVVDGFARILKEDYGRQLDRIGNDHIDRVLVAAARMNAMIDAMLSLARLSAQPLLRQPVNLSQLAGYTMDDLKRSAPERHVDVDIQAGLQAHGDPTLLRQVLDNLLANAWKYSARCTQARISFTRSERDGRPVFEVRDNGAGFDMRSAERLFGLFQRLHSASDFPGTGVGLASVQRIVRRHGGDIWAEAEPGHGARFYFTLGD